MASQCLPELRCSSDIKLRFGELIRGYFYQLTVGCGSPECTNLHCKSCPEFQPLESNTTAFEEAKLLARDGFRMPKPVYYFCRNLPFPVDILHLDVVNHTIMEDCQQAGTGAFMKCISNGFRYESLCYSFLKSYGAPATEGDSGIDIGTLIKAYDLVGIDEEVRHCLSTALCGVAESMETMLKSSTDSQPTAIQLRPLLILFLWPGLSDPNEKAILLPLFRALCLLASSQRKVFVSWLASLSEDRLLFLVVHVVQNFMTLQLLTAEFIEKIICTATIVLGLLYQANVLHGEDGKIDYKEFYNDAVNSVVDIKQDYRRWYDAKKQGRSGEEWENFSFIQYPFILDPASKAAVLGFNATSQQSEVQSAVVTSMLLSGMGGMPVPFSHEDLVCVMRIDRSNLVQSALQQVTMKLDDLKKPVRIKFIGEDGIDEGGVKKEFFQLLTNELFDPQYGMFKYDEESRFHWFNQNSFENTQEFRLIGIMFGLAIYNSVILEIRFPMAVYKKMLGKPVGLADLKQLDPELHKGLCDLLAFENVDTIEEVYARNFVVETEVYGAQMQIPLKPNGANIPLTKDNREEYVQLYTHYILEDSIRKQFDAFNSGFQDICGGDMLKIFRPEELELLICGSPDLDFHGLEKECRYDGYTKNSEVIRNFWEIVHAMDETERKKLLKFCTGSDRVPIKGLSSIIFVIARHGGDSEMLPTAHTCFNHLLLPEYPSKEKLKSKLLLAINNCTGFGLM